MARSGSTEARPDRNALRYSQQMDSDDSADARPRFTRRHVIAGVIVTFGVALGIAACLLVWRPALYFGAPVEAVSNSVSLSVQGSVLLTRDVCRRTTHSTFTCTVGGGDYNYGMWTWTVDAHVEVDPRGCWHAVGREPASMFGGAHSVDATGCLHLSDFRAPL